jgi:hypothetical protein
VVLDRCYKLRQSDGDELVEMNFEFIEDTYNYQARDRDGDTTTWYSRLKSEDTKDFEHFSKVHFSCFYLFYFLINCGLIL